MFFNNIKQCRCEIIHLEFIYFTFCPYFLIILCNMTLSKFFCIGRVGVCTNGCIATLLNKGAPSLPTHTGCVCPHTSKKFLPQRLTTHFPSVCLPPEKVSWSYTPDITDEPLTKSMAFLQSLISVIPLQHFAPRLVISPLILVLWCLGRWPLAFPPSWHWISALFLFFLIKIK